MCQKASISSINHVRSKIKVVFLGQQSTGKTSILMRFMHDKFQQGLGATVGIDFMAKNLAIGTNMLRLQLWDTAGQQRFRSLIPSYLKDAMITFIVFDVGNMKSFQNLTQWFELCSQNKRQKNIIILLGNKTDLEQRQVSKQLAQQKAEEFNVKYFEVSAKRGTNIKQAFNVAGQQYAKINMQQNDISFSKIIESKDIQKKNDQNTIKNGSQSSTIKINNNKGKQDNKKSKGCC